MVCGLGFSFIATHRHAKLPGLGFGVYSFVVRVSGFGLFTVLWIGFRVSGTVQRFGFKVESFRLTCIATRRHAMLPSPLSPPRPPVSGFVVSGSGSRVPGFGFRVSVFRSWVSGFRVSG